MIKSSRYIFILYIIVYEISRRISLNQNSINFNKIRFRLADVLIRIGHCRVILVRKGVRKINRG